MVTTPELTALPELAAIPTPRTSPRARHALAPSVNLRLRHETVWLVPVVLLGIAFLHGWNMYGMPGPVSGDENAYVSQAWAVLRVMFTPYSYTSDHPPGGWSGL